MVSIRRNSWKRLKKDWELSFSPWKSAREPWERKRERENSFRHILFHSGGVWQNQMLLNFMISNYVVRPCRLRVEKAYLQSVSNLENETLRITFLNLCSICMWKGQMKIRQSPLAFSQFPKLAIRKQWIKDFFSFSWFLLPIGSTTDAILWKWCSWK